MPPSPHPGKYRILKRAQEDVVMMPTPRWSPEPICFGTIYPERGPSVPLLIDAVCEIPRQIPNFEVAKEEELPEMMLPEEAQAWIDEFMNNIGSKERGLPRPSNFHVNMTYVLSAMFHAEHDQPSTMEGDYLAAEPMMAHINIEKAGQGESSQAELPGQLEKRPERIYSDKMVFIRPNPTLANHLKPIYVTAHLEGVPFRRVLIDGGAAVNVLPYKQMKKMCRGEEDLIPTDLTVSSFS